MTSYISEKYHTEIAERYKQSTEGLSEVELSKILKLLGFEIDASNISKATGGNMNATYLTPDFVIKIQSDKALHKYLANKIISDQFSGNLPVVDVLAYDFFDKTEYEVLVMKRSEGSLLLYDFLNLDQSTQKKLFGETVDISNALASLSFSDFGDIRYPDQAFDTFKGYLEAKFETYRSIIIDQELGNPADIAQISSYFKDNIDVFKQDSGSVFVHSDLHFGNVLHSGGKVTAILDFDVSVKAPLYMTLPKFIAVIDEPAQFVEGTSYYKAYENKKFEYLYPVLREKMAPVFQDPNLVQRLNLVGIMKGFSWISENWSTEWNKHQIEHLIHEEIATDRQTLDRSYYGKTVAKIIAK